MLMAVMVHNDTVIEMLAAIPLTKNRKKKKLPPFLENGDQTSTINKLYEANAEVTCHQIAKKYFGSLVKGSLFVKGD